MFKCQHYISNPDEISIRHCEWYKPLSCFELKGAKLEVQGYCDYCEAYVKVTPVIESPYLHKWLKQEAVKE